MLTTSRKVSDNDSYLLLLIEGGAKREIARLKVATATIPVGCWWRLATRKAYDARRMEHPRDTCRHRPETRFQNSHHERRSTLCPHERDRRAPDSGSDEMMLEFAKLVFGPDATISD